MTQKVLLILADDRGISTFPAVYQSASELKKRGFHVTLLTGSECDDVTLAELFDIYIKCIFKFSRFDYFQNNIFCAVEIYRQKYDYVFAFEPKDAINTALSTILFRKVKYIYYNLEVFHLSIDGKLTLSNILRRILFGVRKSFEKIYARKSACLVIQDDLRRALFEKYCLVVDKVYLIPNSYYQNASYRREIVKDNLKVLYSGGLEKWSISKIFEEINKLNSVQLTLSGWSRDKYLDKVANTISCNPNIKLYEGKLSISDYIDLVNEHDIGLVWYSSNVANVKYIGRSSGKLFMFLSCGMPVIVQNLPGMADDVHKYELGIVIDDLSQLGEAIKRIKEDYAFYSNNVERIYKEMFDYSIASLHFFNSFLRDSRKEVKD